MFIRVRAELNSGARAGRRMGGHPMVRVCALSAIVGSFGLSTGGSRVGRTYSGRIARSPSVYRNSPGPAPRSRSEQQFGEEKWDAKPREYTDTPSWTRKDPPAWRLEAESLGAEFLYGVNPVLAALRRGRRKMHKLLIQDSMELSKRKDASAVLIAEQLAEKLQVPVERANKAQLNAMCENRPPHR